MDERKTEHPVDRSRRDLVKVIATGAAYVSPVIATLAAPSRLMAQGPSAMQMWMICDYFPVLCMIFGGSANLEQGQTAPWSQQGPGTTPSSGQGPFVPPPGATPPPGSAPPGQNPP